MGDIEPFAGDHAPRCIDLTQAADTELPAEPLTPKAEEVAVKQEPVCTKPPCAAADSSAEDDTRKVVIALAGAFVAGALVGAFTVAVFSKLDVE